MELAKMTSPEAKEALAKADFVLVPVGSTEQHGPHLPLDNDAYTATKIAYMVAEKLAGRLNILVAPTIPYGMSIHHMDFAGTITLSFETFKSIVKEVCLSLARHGAKRIVIVNGHGGNTATIRFVVHELLVENREVRVFAVDWWDAAPDTIKKLTGSTIGHADDAETSVALALGQRVKKEVAKGKELKKPDYSPFYYTVFRRAKDITETGATGNPEKASEEKGRKIVEAVVTSLAKKLEDIAKERSYQK